jgi:AP-3 complex subunit mu
MITSRITHHAVEDIVVSMDLGRGATSVSATATGDRRPLGSSIGHGGAGRKDESSEGWVGGGTWEFDPNTQMLKAVVGDVERNVERR